METRESIIVFGCENMHPCSLQLCRNKSMKSNDYEENWIFYLYVLSTIERILRWLWSCSFCGLWARASAHSHSMYANLIEQLISIDIIRAMYCASNMLVSCDVHTWQWRTVSTLTTMKTLCLCSSWLLNCTNIRQNSIHSIRSHKQMQLHHIKCGKKHIPALQLST